FPVGGRPLVNLSFAINYAIHGERTSGYQLTNLAFHVACGLLVFGVMRRALLLSGATLARTAQPLALATALLWIVHPLNSEVVNYLSQRTESAMAMAFLLTIYCSLRAAAAPGADALWLGIGVVACAAGMASKESMVTAPIVVLIFDRVFLFASSREAARTRPYFYLGLAASWLVLGGLLLQAPRAPSNGFDTTLTSPWTYLLNQAVMIAHYLRLVVWPDRLAIYYGWVQPVTLGDVWPFVLLVGALAGASVWCLLRAPRVGFLTASVFITLAPTSSILPIGAEVGAERRMYLPMVALTALVVLAGHAAWRRLAIRPYMTPAAQRFVQIGGIGLVVCVTAALAVRTFLRTEDYASALTLARGTVAAWPNGAAHKILGTELFNRFGPTDEALRELRTAADSMAPAAFDLGIALLSAGDTSGALAVLEAFVRAEPRLATTATAHKRIGQIYENREQWDQARLHYERSLTLAPSDAEVRLGLALALSHLQAYGAAVPHYEAVIAKQPGSFVAWMGLGVAHAGEGGYAAAVTAFETAVRLNPADIAGRVNLARARLDAGDVDGALAAARDAAATAPNDPDVQRILGAVAAAHQP
ncbi:MAG: tetratricopeptide repeat protein, partial [Xanthomonadales bacterium]|nr:tetratricopeptide repeat protein [Xanthomonadales bacterium]